MKIRLFAIVVSSVTMALLGAVPGLAQDKAKPPKWELVWSDEFNGSRINEKYWSKIDRGKSGWSNYMSPDPSLYAVKGGNLILRGKVNPDTKKDPVPYLTGGVWTKGKYSFLYGKIEIRAKLGCAQGAWPAIWLLPDKKDRKWPDDGEIDLVEHLNFDDFAYQTLHTKYTISGNKNPRNSTTKKINRDGYNVYGVEWYPDKLVFLLNGEKTFEYPCLPNLQDKGQWPFTSPFFILIDMQLEGNWVGKVTNPKQLPIEMCIDWVRVYRDANSKTPAKKK